MLRMDICLLDNGSLQDNAVFSLYWLSLCTTYNNWHPTNNHDNTHVSYKIYDKKNNTWALKTRKI